MHDGHKGIKQLSKDSTHFYYVHKSWLKIMFYDKRRKSFCTLRAAWGKFENYAFYYYFYILKRAIVTFRKIGKL